MTSSPRRRARHGRRPDRLPAHRAARTPTGTSYGVTLDAATAERLGAPAGVALHPSFVYEIVFHAAAFAVLWLWLRHRLTAPGETLTFYLAGYGIFRFLVEYVRATRSSGRG